MEAVVHGDARISKLIGRPIEDIALPEGVTIAPWRAATRCSWRTTTS